MCLHSYALQVSFQPLSSSLAYPGLMSSVDLVNCKTVGTVSRISDTFGGQQDTQRVGSLRLHWIEEASGRHI